MKRQRYDTANVVSLSFCFFTCGISVLRPYLQLMVILAVFKPGAETVKVVLPFFSLLRMTPKARPFHALCLLSAVVSISLMSAFPAARRVDLPLSVKVSSVVALGQTVPFLSTTSTVINERS